MSDTQILWSYPLIFHRVRRVDSRYAYLVVKDGYVPLKRREGMLWKYVKYGEWRSNYDPTAPSEYFEKVVLSDYDEVSTFFQTKLQEEYVDNYEGFEELGVLWDKKYDELYGMCKAVKDAVNRKREKAIAKELKRLYDIEDIQVKTALLERRLKSCDPLDKTGYETTSRKLRECKESKHVDPCSISVTFDDENPRSNPVKLQSVKDCGYYTYAGKICFYDDGNNEPTYPWY